MGLLVDCEELFGTSDLYKLLGVPKEASEAAIKKAYRRLSLLVHPDRAEGDQKDAATRKFQVLSKVHVILSDSDRRAAYDDTGCVDEDDDLASDRDWTSYWRFLFPKITKADIEQYLDKYRGSKDEEADLEDHYERFEGDFDAISERLIGYQFEEEDRYREILNRLIKAGKVKAYPKFTKETKKSRSARRNKYMKEAEEAEEMKAELGLDDGNESLLSVIAKRQKSREAEFGDMIASLEAKYCKPKKKKTK
uniref:Putative molecular chaperone dnaj superfamily n=1 Tax=Amblyomma aureolatum TaxID=187763 RepID=A0A1E1X5Q5_9ACAR